MDDPNNLDYNFDFLVAFYVQYYGEISYNYKQKILKILIFMTY